MPNICNVPGCVNGNYKVTRDNNVSVFSIPKQSLLAWEKILNCQLKQNYGICQAHFHPKDIKSSIIMRDKNGKIIQEVSKNY